MLKKKRLGKEECLWKRRQLQRSQTEEWIRPGTSAGPQHEVRWWELTPVTAAKGYITVACTPPKPATPPRPATPAQSPDAPIVFITPPPALLSPLPHTLFRGPPRFSPPGPAYIFDKAKTAPVLKLEDPRTRQIVRSIF